uniref:Uncharacterized protein n=1 Tax=Escherichia coli TaxID=562 RepID=A0A7L8KA18_ECOLX|nr:hypothetical protein [Escherichia coli]UCK65627.1 hypothetical protein [Providencia rettgeri]
MDKTFRRKCLNTLVSSVEEKHLVRRTKKPEALKAPGYRILYV